MKPENENSVDRKKRMPACASCEKELSKRICMTDLVESIFTDLGFEVVSVICKAGRTPKSVIGLEDKDTIFLDRNEAMCKPIYQAKLLNHEHTEFNVLLGLCVGHDSLFFRYAEAPTTVLAAKDRVTGQNPLAAVYLSSSYYARIKDKDI